MPTFLESLWIALYSAEVQRQYAAHTTTGRSVLGGTVTQAHVQAIAAGAEAFASAMVSAIGAASVADLQATIAALKPAE